MFPQVYATPLGQTVKSTELYDFLELRKADYTRWSKKWITDNPMFEPNKDYSASMRSNAKDGKRGRFRIEYDLHIDFAKKLCMVSDSKRADEIRDYLVELSNKVEKNDLLTHNQVLYLVQLKEVFKYVTNCKEAEDMHKAVFVQNSTSKNPWAEFHTYRNEILKLDPQEVDLRIKQWCIDNDKNLPKKTATKTDKLLLLDKYEVVRNGVWDFLMAKGSEQAMKLANLVKNMLELEKTYLSRKNEYNLFEEKTPLEIKDIALLEVKA